ncbi:MAG: hypothetical protein WAU68_11375 [Vitreimonas sp.]
MRFVAEPISDLRLQRFHRWAMLWLKWLVSFLDGAGAFAPISEQAGAIGHRWLDDIERIILNIVMLRAAPSVRRNQPHKGVSRRRRNDAAVRRAIVGSHLRRALRRKNLHQRIEALSQSVAALVARLLRRLPHGLTRRRPIVAAPELRAADARTSLFGPARAADTS